MNRGGGAKKRVFIGENANKQVLKRTFFEIQDEEELQNEQRRSTKGVFIGGNANKQVLKKTIFEI